MGQNSGGAQSFQYLFFFAILTSKDGVVVVAHVSFESRGVRDGWAGGGSQLITTKGCSQFSSPSIQRFWGEQGGRYRTSDTKIKLNSSSAPKGA